MKAFEIKNFGTDGVDLVEREVPSPKNGEVLVKMRAASLNYRDLMIAAGEYNPKMQLPAVPLSDGAGEIVQTGEGVSRWQVGDRVCPIFAPRWLDGELSLETSRSALGAGARSNGVLRQYACFSEESLVPIPQHLTFEEAATLPCAAVTAWHALIVSGKLKAGDTVLTLGTGGVSVFAIQIAKMCGAKVIATTGSGEKIIRLKQIGADETINYKQNGNWSQTVLDLTQKRGVDHVVEVGGAGTLARSVSAVRVAGHVAMIGALSGGGDFNPITAFMKAVRLQGIFVGSRAMFEDMNRAVEMAAVRPVIDRVYDFEQFIEAMAYMRSGSHFGKIVIRIDQ